MSLGSKTPEFRKEPHTCKEFNVRCPNGDRITMLAQFIKYLEKENLVIFDILGKDETHFRNRFRIQKYAFLAKRFGLDLPYQHSIYMYGPYSESLTNEYYALARDGRQYAAATPDLPESFQREGFLDLVRGRSDGWLEIATSLISKTKRITQRDVLVENTEYTKVGFTFGFIEGVLRDLEETGLLKLSR